MRSLITALLMTLAVSTSAATHVSWSSSDVTVVGFELFLNGALVATPGAPARQYTYSNCAKAGDKWAILAVNGQGIKSALSDPPAVQPRDECATVAVTTPAGLKLTVANPTITVSWNAVPGAVSYEVYLNGNRMATVKGLQSLRTVQVGKCITKADFYTVRAVAADGSRSPAATPVAVTAAVCNVSCP